MEEAGVGYTVEMLHANLTNLSVKDITEPSNTRVM